MNVKSMIAEYEEEHNYETRVSLNLEASGQVDGYDFQLRAVYDSKSLRWANYRVRLTMMKDHRTLNIDEQRFHKKEDALRCFDAISQENGLELCPDGFLEDKK